MSEPRVSVVVGTHDRPERLRWLLCSLRKQQLHPEDFEVIVVDDGSGPATEQILAEAQDRFRLVLRVVRHESARGPAAARNSGWQAARAPLVAFTDDDCRADSRWLSTALKVHAEHPGVIIQGRTEPDSRERANASLLSRTVRVDALGPQYETCNIFYPRALLESLGGFDECYGLTPGGEDTDLAWRAIAAGCTPMFAPEALVHHAVERLGVRGMLRVAARWSAPMRVFADHPQSRTMLYRGVFWNVWHYLLWRSLLSVPAPDWLRRMLLTQHVLALRKRARDAGASGAMVPFLLVHDAVECWAVARGALRHRTLVL